MMGTGSNNKLLCICQICTCGRHHCVHHPKATTKPSGPCNLTEYKDTYRKFSNFQPPRPIRPDAGSKFSGKPLDGTTMYAQEYHPHNLEPRKKREQAKYIKPNGAFNGTSSYQYDYTEKSADKMPSARPLYQPITSNRPFSGTTVHKETYKQWDLPVSHGIKQASAIKLPIGKFDHKTTFQNDFTGHSGYGGRPMIRPMKPTLSVGAGRLSDETTTRADYTPKDARPEKSAKPAQYVLHHTDPFDHKSTFQHTFLWPNGRPADSCRPVQLVRRSSQPLDDLTTHNMTYKPWEIPKKVMKPTTAWTRPSDPFDCKTTFQQDFDGKYTRPAKSARPDYNRVAPGDFRGTTTHKDAYKPWEVSARENFRPKGEYKPHGKFDGVTTFQTDFQGHGGERRDLCVPKGSGLAFSGPQDYSTMYRDTYLGERPPSCPAKYLDSQRNIVSRNGYIYKIDREGHQFYKPPYANEYMEELSSPMRSKSLSKSIEVLAL